MPTPDNTTAPLLSDLAAWSDDTRSFHGDRQLADRILLVTGWRCLPDPEHPARVKWEFGTNPVYTAWEPHHPHPVNSVDDALGQLPYLWRVCGMTQPDGDGEWRVQAVGRDGGSVFAAHRSLSIAISIVAAKAWDQTHD